MSFKIILKLKILNLKLLNSKGFTLLELLIYIAILAIITLVIANAFIMLNRSRGQVEAKNEVSSNLRFALEKTRREVVTATNLITPADKNTSSSSLALAAGGDTIRYFASSSQLFRQVNANAPERITGSNVKIDSINFKRLENTNTVLKKKRVSVEISLAVSYNSLSPDWQYSASDKTTAELSSDL